MASRSLSPGSLPTQTPTAVGSQSITVSRSPTRVRTPSCSVSAHLDDGRLGYEYDSQDYTAAAVPPPTSRTPTVVGKGGRNVRVPQRERADSGSFGLYNGNWGGAKRNRVVQQHICSDLLNGPAQVICAQEADTTVCRYLERGYDETPTVVGETGEPQSPTAVGRKAWLVARGYEMGSTCMIAVRGSMASQLRLLHWHRHADGDYVGHRAKGIRRVAYTRTLVAEAA